MLKLAAFSNVTLDKLLSSVLTLNEVRILYLNNFVDVPIHTVLAEACTTSCRT